MLFQGAYFGIQKKVKYMHVYISDKHQLFESSLYCFSWSIKLGSFPVQLITGLLLFH